MNRSTTNKTTNDKRMSIELCNKCHEEFMALKKDYHNVETQYILCYDCIRDIKRAEDL